MVSSQALTVEQYLQELDPKHRPTIQKVRQLVNDNLPKGYQETMQYGMIGWIIPLSVFPKTYNNQPLTIAGLARQKNDYVLYLNHLYASSSLEKEFYDGYAASGKKLKMGKSCLHFTSEEKLATDVIATSLQKANLAWYIDVYLDSRKKIM